MEALQDADWVTPPSPNGGVLLGPGLALLASAGVRPAQLTVLRPFLVKLSDELNETVDLSIRRRDQAMFVDQVTAHQRLRAVSAVGEAFPLYSCANGKALLATFPDPLIEILLGQSFRALTSQTITTLPMLLSQITEVRRTGVSYDREEHSAGICAVGRVMPTPDGGYAAVSIPLPAQRFYGCERQLADTLSSACVSLPGETRESLNRSGKAWELLAPYGLTPDNADLERHSVYTFQACWATRWREGRLLLAGDAAHLMPPFAGQGLGARVRDVMNLSWKLDAVLRGLAGDRLLDTYGSERLKHAIAFIRFSKELGQIICVTDPVAAAARDTRMIAQWNAGRKPPAPPRPGLGNGLHAGRAGGQLARQGRVAVADGRPVMFDDAFNGPGAVIARSGKLLEGIPDDQRVLLSDLAISLVGLSGPSRAGMTVVRDADGVYAAWLDALDADLVFVRPDFHLYGAARADTALDLVAGFCSQVRTP